MVNSALNVYQTSFSKDVAENIIASKKLLDGEVVK